MCKTHDKDTSINHLRKESLRGHRRNVFHNRKAVPNIWNVEEDYFY